MKTYVQHDLSGAIKAIISLDAPEDAGLFLSQGAGIMITEVDGIKLKAGMPEIDEVRAIARSHRVTGLNSKAILSKR